MHGLVWLQAFGLTVQAVVYVLVDVSCFLDKVKALAGFEAYGFKLVEAVLQCF